MKIRRRCLLAIAIVFGGASATVQWPAQQPASTSSAPSSMTTAASTLASMSGHASNPLTPDVNYQSSHKESVDKALRACIETSVLALIKRVDLSANTSAQK
jgi:hypothetical protein